jgi:hypothetical protein
MKKFGGSAHDYLTVSKGPPVRSRAAKVSTAGHGHRRWRRRSRPEWIHAIKIKYDGFRIRVERRALRLDLPRPPRALNLQCLKLLHDDKGQITQLF